MLLLAARTASAQTGAGGSTPVGSEAGPPARKQAQAVRVTGAAPHVDGRLDEPAWEQARFFSDFIQKEPVEGAEPTERTQVAFLYDEDALYVAIRCFKNDLADIRRSVSRRDGSGTGQSEHVWISLDTYRDRRTAYSFGITAAGVRMDWYHPSDHETDNDFSFDPVWDGEARLDSAGWSAEMRIPFSQLRFRPQDEQVWGLNVDRWIPSRNEDDFWIPVPRSGTGWSSRMGELTGITGIRPSRRLELLPYVASNATVTSQADAANPFDPDGRSVAARFGGDLKMGLGPNLTVEATVNPDFGQVEGDPAVVNLSAFEIFFDERRPFFTEGNQLLRGDGPAYFYSRRIGETPRGDAGADYVDRPGNATILGAAKLTGRLASGLSVGGLGAVTGREWARTYDVAADSFGRVEVATPTGYGVLRLRQEFGPSQSTVGVMVTGVRRDLPSGSALAAVLNRQAFSGGLDWNLRFKGGAYNVSGYLGFSRVQGDSTAILAQQLSSRRYYQRPDQSYVRVDSSRTSLGGYSAGLNAGKNSGRHWLWSVSGGVESPGLELNDAGRISTADGLNAFGRLTFRETSPGRVFRGYSVSLYSGAEWNGAYDRQYSYSQLDLSATWRNQWSTSGTFWVDYRGQDERATRGGPSMAFPADWTTIWQLRSNSAAKTQWNARVYYQRDELDGLTYRLSGALTLRLFPRWSLSASPNYLRTRSARQYVATIPDPLAVATYGARYVFAAIDQSQWAVPIRFNYAFTPDLTLELYAEPFLASGRYYRHGELDAPRSLGLRIYGEALGTSAVRDSAGAVSVTDGGATFTLDNGDFNLISFRSNIVLRWEWRRGSTLFLVWQQNRGSSDARGDLVRVPDLFRGLRASGDNFLAIKVSYWISVD